MARFIPAAIIGLTAVGLAIGGVSPAWWITGLVAIGFAVTIGVGTSLSLGGRMALAPYVPAFVTGLVAVGLGIAGASPAWWITGLVTVGLATVKFMASH
ncbi:MAG TPA: hypothetical protein VFR32_04685 [Gaiellaceae bacterium]|nr:hypothetical protein [Gaiellaceae bacterium]